VSLEEDIFAGVRVVELAQWVFVPAAGGILADWGADVIRIERPEGDPYRGLATQGIGTDSGGVNLNIALVNRGKRSLAIDLKSTKGLEVLHKLLSSADIFLTNLRPKALRKLGLDADQLMEQYPGLIYARGNGFGSRGPDADHAGYDTSAFFARGGVADALTPVGSAYPILQRGAMGDRNGGMALAFGIVSALFKKLKTGRGSVVDVSLLAVAMMTLSSDILTALKGAEMPRPSKRSEAPNPLTCAYKTADDRFIQLVFIEGDRYWADLCRVLDREDLILDSRFVDLKARRENSAQCVEFLDSEFGNRSYAECKLLLSKIDAPWAPVQRVEELLEDPQVLANGYLGDVVGDDGQVAYRLPTVPVQFNEKPPTLHRAPELGEHTETILSDLGYEWEAIAQFQAEGIIP